MKNYSRLIILLAILSLAACGCDSFESFGPKKTEDDTLTVVLVEDPHLAKLILKPQQKAINVSRDPFRPLHDWSNKRSDAKLVEPVKQLFSNVAFIGMIKMGNQSIALLKAGEKKLMLKKNEKYKDFTLTEISNIHVTFSDGATQITLKRGGKK